MAWGEANSLDSPTRRSSHSITILIHNLLNFATNSLTAILIYRFLLDLQEANEHNVRVGSDDPELQMSQTSSQSSLSFMDRAIGSLGSTIHPRTAPARDGWDEDILDESELEGSHSGELADEAVPLDDLVVQPESHSEIQEVPRDEPLSLAV